MIRQWLDDHWLLVYFGVDAAMFVAAVLLWNPGSRPIAGALFVFALIPPLAFVTVLATDRLVEPGDEAVRGRRRG